MDPGRSNRDAWDVASTKYVVESDAFLEGPDARSLADVERRLLDPILATAPRVVHLQSGNGTDCVQLLHAGAVSAVGVDFSAVTVAAASGRARTLGSSARYVVGDALAVPLADASADLVYTGKGALVWLHDLTRWATEVARLLAPGGRLFVFDAHPAEPLWTHEPSSIAVRDDRSYFASARVNDTFPASAIARYAEGEAPDAVEWQWTLADVVNAVVGAGLVIEHLGEHPEPFWRPGGAAEAEAWRGRVPNSFTLLARR
jgi:SAM-dependent methyltransferase